MSDAQSVPSGLSMREREVADAYAAGQSYKEIARELGLAPTTVRSHLRTVYGKLGVTSKIELARFLADETAPDAKRDMGELAAELALELDEAVRRERSLARVLRIISDQDGELDGVIDAVLEHALEICEAEYGHLFEYHGDFMFREMRSRGISQAFTAWLSEMGIFRVEPTTGIGRAAAELKPVSITDIRAGGLYETGSPLRVASVDLGKGRSLAAIPMMSGKRLIGVFSVYRTRVHPFSERALELAQLFADQAAIAIENVRRFRQLQARAERDAATREILQVLSESRDDDAPVFDAILENACKLCDAPLAYLSLVTADRKHVVSPARRGAFESFGETLDRLRVPLDTSPLALARAIAECRVFREDDISDSDVYRNGDPNRVSMVEDERARSLLVVPLTRNGLGIGSITLYRREVAPFSDEDVALVEGFAAQAVIAIENVQQFRELAGLNAELGERVQAQVGEIERMGRLKRFLSPAVADALVTAGEESILASHRALIATLFCDIRGFTAFCETAEPEETIEVLQAYHEEMGTLISAHGAGVDKRMGDGIMVIFNDPLPSDDPAGDAVRLAVTMRDRMAELCRQWKRHGHRLGFGVGISLGYATIGMVGSEGRYDYTASGTAVNLAARLCDRAEDGEILLSPRAYSAVEDDFRAESSGELNLKGIREPVEVFRLLAS